MSKRKADLSPEALAQGEGSRRRAMGAEIIDSKRELIPHHGLAAVTLIVLIAFALGWSFAPRHSNLLGVTTSPP